MCWVSILITPFTFPLPLAFVLPPPPFIPEGCMGMYNAFFDDELLNAAGIYKERLSQVRLPWAFDGSV